MRAHDVDEPRHRSREAARALLRTAWGRALVVVALAVGWLAITLLVLRTPSSPVTPVIALVIAAAFWRFGDATERRLTITALSYALSQPLVAGMRVMGNGVPGLVVSTGGSFVIFAGTATPAVVAADRWLRGWKADYERMLGRIPYVVPVAYGLIAVEGAVASVLWTSAVGNADVAGVELAIFGGVAATTFAAIREDRMRASRDLGRTAAADGDRRGP